MTLNMALLGELGEWNHWMNKINAFSLTIGRGQAFSPCPLPLYLICHWTHLGSVTHEHPKKKSQGSNKRFFVCSCLLSLKFTAWQMLCFQPSPSDVFLSYLVTSLQSQTHVQK
ncbi:hypothetical protein ATANTOWER_030014 [Ataeniobius toweri]|uniref:Uncharacterized protein n=1 Tax=Ataeniobius toweri TaxID=208326 RepID=A0ABU7A303_9TELE|nr:hypothetical protein [Ataeniobius toweri]